MSRPSLTVAVVSHNEAEELDAALAQVHGCDEILVLDMQSEDGTRQVARKYSARVLPVPFAPIAERVRQRGVEACATDWLLWLDADERPPADLEILRPHLTADVAGYWAPFTDVAFGVPVPHFSHGAAKIALVRPQLAFWSSAAPAHTQPQLNGAAGSLVGAIPAFLHYNLRSVDQGLEKVVRYGRSGGSTVQVRRVDDPLLLPRLLWRNFVGRRAWEDGTAGSVAGNLAAISDYLAALQQWEEAGRPQSYCGPVARSTLRAGRSVSNALWPLRDALRSLRARGKR